MARVILHTQSQLEALGWAFETPNIPSSNPNMLQNTQLPNSCGWGIHGETIPVGHIEFNAEQIEMFEAMYVYDSIGAGVAYLQSLLPIVPKTVRYNTYTASGWVKMPRNVSGDAFAIFNTANYDSGPNSNILKIYVDGIEQSIEEATFPADNLYHFVEVVQQIDLGYDTDCIVFTSFAGSDLVQSAYLYGLKLEEGARATPWVPNSLDTYSVIKAYKAFNTGSSSEEYYERISATLEEAVLYANAIEYGYDAMFWKPGDMYFPKNMLYQWISPQQLEQFEKMYVDCVAVSYQSALGYIYSQIGELYDMDSILSGDTNDGTAKIMRWMLTVLTAYNLSSPSAKHSQTLQDNFDMVTKKVTEMKTGATTLHDAPIKEAPNAWGDVVNGTKYKMLG